MPPSSVSNAIASAHNALGLGLVGNAALPLSPWWPNVNMRVESYFNRLDITSTTNTLTFFQSTYSDFITNLPQPGYIPGEHAMWATSLGFTIQQGYTAAGAAAANGEPFQTDVDPSTVAADMKALVEHGLVELKIGTVVVARRYGLHHFPAGGGLSGWGAISNTTTTTINHSQFPCNGVPSQDNKHRFLPPIAIYPNDQILLTVRWPFSRTLAAGLVIQADLEGPVVSPR